MIDSKVIIVGGGPAGAACAWQLKKAQVPTIILDKETFPRVKLCAGWITPRVLKKLQLVPDKYPHGLVKFNRLHVYINGKHIPIPTRQYSIRRYEFDHWLLKRAGVPVHQHQVKTIREEKGYYIIDETYRCQFLVGAGGTNCPVYRHFFMPQFPKDDNLRVTAMEQEFPYDYHDNRCHLWFYENDLSGYAWYVPKANGYLNVGVGGYLSVMKEKGQTIQQHWQALRQKLESLGLVTDFDFRPKGYNYYLRAKRTALYQNTVFLAGDAAGLATLDMGEGIGPAIESGLLVAQSIITKKPYSVRSIPKYSLPRIVWPW